MKEGIYFNKKLWKFASLEEEGNLPEGYTQVSPLILLILGPLMGLAYAIFLPAIGLLMVSRVIVHKLSNLVAPVGVEPTESAV